MTVTIDKKLGVVTVSGITVDLAPRKDAAGNDVPRPLDVVNREMLSSALDALNKAHTATQLDDAKLAAMVAAKQVEADAIKAARPAVIEKVAAAK